MTYCYSIHDILTVQSDVSLHIPDKFLIEETTEPDITLRKRSFDIDREQLRRKKRKDYTVWIDDDSITFSYEMLDLRLRISGLTEQTEIDVTPRLWKFQEGDVHKLIEELLQLHLLETNHSFLHAGAVTNGDHLMLLPAIGTTGKTYTTISLVDGNSRYILSDDRVIVSENGTVYSYPMVVNTGPYQLQNPAVPELSVNPRLSSYLADKPFFSILFGKFFWLYPSKSAEIPDRVLVDSGTPTHAFTFSAGDADTPKPITHEEMVRRCMIQHYDTFNPFSNYLLNYSTFLLDYDLTNAISDAREVISAALEGVDCYDIENGDKSVYPEQILQTVE